MAAVGSELEDRAAIRCSSLVGRAVEVAAAIERETGIGVGAVAPCEAVEDGVRAIRSEPEDGAVAERASGRGRAAEEGRPEDVAGGIHYELTQRVGAVAHAEAVNHGEGAVGRELEDSAVMRVARQRQGRRAIHIARAVEDDPGLGDAIRRREVVEDGGGAAGSDLEEGAVVPGAPVVGRAIEVAGSVHGQAADGRSAGGLAGEVVDEGDRPIRGQLEERPHVRGAAARRAVQRAAGTAHEPAVARRILEVLEGLQHLVRLRTRGCGPQ